MVALYLKAGYRASPEYFATWIAELSSSGDRHPGLELPQDSSSNAQGCLICSLRALLSAGGHQLAACLLGVAVPQGCADSERVCRGS